MLGIERQLNAGDMQAVFLPSRGMLGVSLRHRGPALGTLRYENGPDRIDERGRGLSGESQGFVGHVRGVGGAVQRRPIPTTPK